MSFEISCHLRFHVIWDFVSFEISCQLRFHAYLIFVTGIRVVPVEKNLSYGEISNFCTWNIWRNQKFMHMSINFKFNVIWDFMPFEIWCLLRFHVIWDFLSIEVSCHLRFHIIWDFMLFENSCHMRLSVIFWILVIWDFLSFEISCPLRFHVIWDFMSFVGEPTFISPASHLNIFQLLWYLQTTWWGDNHPVTKACGRENKEEKKN